MISSAMFFYNCRDRFYEPDIHITWNKIHFSCLFKLNKLIPIILTLFVFFNIDLMIYDLNESIICLYNNNKYNRKYNKLFL